MRRGGVTLPAPAVALAPVVKYIAVSSCSALPRHRQHQRTRTSRQRQSSHAWQRLQLGTPCHLQWYSSHVLRQRQWRNNASASEAEYISPASAVIGASAPEVEYVALASAVRSNHAMCTPRHCLPRSWRRPQPGAQRQRQRRSPAPAVTATPAPVAVYITVPTWRQLRPCAQRQHQWRRHRAETSDVAASHSQTAVAAAGTLRRHIRILLLRQQGRCGVTFSDCCCGSRDVAASHSQTAVSGSRDVAASHSQTAVAAAETLRRQTRRLLLRQQRRCGVTLSDCCCGSRDVAASHSQTAVAAAETLQLPEFSAEQRWSQCCPSIDCESSFSGQRLSKCLWSGIPQIRRWCQIIEICCDV